MKCPFLYHKPPPKLFLWIPFASQPWTTCNNTSTSYQYLHLQDHPRKAARTTAAMLSLYKQRISCTVSGELMRMLGIRVGVSTRMHFFIVTDSSGQMVAFDGIGNKCSLHGWPDCTEQTAWVSGLPMSTLWILCWGSGGCGMDTHLSRCILFECRDTVTQSRGLLLCHSSATITSYCSTIVHNFWTWKTSRFLHVQQTHWTGLQLSVLGMLWINVDKREFQFLTLSSNFAQLF